MSEKKNIVIKVKYPNPNSTAENKGSVQKLITEWNFKRIGLALGGLALLMGGFYLAFNTDGDKPKEYPASSPIVADKQTQDRVLEQTSSPKSEAATLPVAEVTTSGAVARAMLTDKIDRNEPGKTLATPLQIRRKETRNIYYFAELKGMKGNTIFHEWYLNDQLVSRKKVNISSDPWRTSSKQMITYTMNNDWKVRLTDKEGNILNEKKFNLELK